MNLFDWIALGYVVAFGAAVYLVWQWMMTRR